VGATDWCTHPPDLDVARVRGTKNPDVEAIVALRPDLVVANEEENRLVDLDLLRAAGVPIWVTDIRTVRGGLTSLSRLFGALGVRDVGWLADAERAWADPATVASQRSRAWCRSGAGRGCTSGATRTPATSCGGWASTTCWPDHDVRLPPRSRWRSCLRTTSWCCRRAVRVQRHRRARGVRRPCALIDGRRAHVVWTGDGGRAAGAARAAARAIG
jgi:hypothetical protein